MRNCPSSGGHPVHALRETLEDRRLVRRPMPAHAICTNHPLWSNQQGASSPQPVAGTRATSSHVARGSIPRDRRSCCVGGEERKEEERWRRELRKEKLNTRRSKMRCQICLSVATQILPSTAQIGRTRLEVVDPSEGASNSARVFRLSRLQSRITPCLPSSSNRRQIVEIHSGN